MVVDITVPELSASVGAAVVAKWMVDVDDVVKSGDSLVMLDTTTIAIVITAASDGIITSIDQPAGSNVTVNQVLGTLEANYTGHIPVLVVSMDEETDAPRPMRRFGPLLITAALALLAFGAYRLADAIRAAPPVIDGPSGAVLYASDFEIAPEEWDTYEGRLSARVDGGILKIDIGDVQSAPFVPTRWHFRDFDAQVIAAAVGGPDINGYGILFRARDADNYYSFLISSDGYYRVARAVNGVEREISTWMPSDAVNTDFGSPNVLGVRGVGDRFTFTINGRPVDLCLPDDPDGQSTYSGGQCFGTLTDALVDAAHGTGRLGLIAVALDDPDVSIVFDNLVVTMP